MAEPDEVASIRIYVAEHRATYDREALRRKLLADGYSADAVDLAIAQVYASTDRVPAGNMSGHVLLLYCLIISGILFLNTLLLPALLKYLYEARGWWPPYAPPYGFVLWAAPAEWVLAWLLRRLAAPPWLWRAINRAVLLYVVLLPVWIGVCLALVGQNIAG